MQRYVPTDDDRKNVELLVGFGLTQREICLLVKNPSTGKPISINTLGKCYQHELDSGVAHFHSAVAGSLYKKALSKDHPQAVTAAIWLSKARMGWSEKVEHEVTAMVGVLVAPASQTPNEWIEQAQKANESKAPPEE